MNIVVNPFIEFDALLLEEITDTMATRIRNQVPTCVETTATSSSSSSRNLILSLSLTTPKEAKRNHTIKTGRIGYKVCQPHIYILIAFVILQKI